MKAVSNANKAKQKTGDEKLHAKEGNLSQNPFISHSSSGESNPFAKNNVESNPFGSKVSPNPFGTAQAKMDGMPSAVQQQMENSLGADFSDVKVHTNSSQAKQMGAHAFAQGNNIHFAQGKFDPNSKSGQTLIGHELAHVKQQREGRVKPDMKLGKTLLNTNNSLEKEADTLGAKAAEGKSNSTPTVQNKLASTTTNTSQVPVQGFFGSLVSKGLNFLKSKVVEMIPEEYKAMVPAPLREMASNLADSGIEAASALAEEKGGELVAKAKSKLATLVPPKLMTMVDSMPPELRTYIEGVLQKGGQLAENALQEGRIPTGDELKAFGKGAAMDGVDVAKTLVPQAIPAEAKELLDKLPPQIKGFGERQFNKGMDTLKGGIESGEMPDVATFAEEAMADGIGTGEELASELAGTVLENAPPKIQSAIESLPPEVKDFIMQKLASAS